MSTSYLTRHEAHQLAQYLVERHNAYVNGLSVADIATSIYQYSVSSYINVYRINEPESYLACDFCCDDELGDCLTDNEAFFLARYAAIEGHYYDSINQQTGKDLVALILRLSITPALPKAERDIAITKAHGAMGQMASYKASFSYGCTGIVVAELNNPTKDSLPIPMQIPHSKGSLYYVVAAINVIDETIKLKCLPADQCELYASEVYPELSVFELAALEKHLAELYLQQIQAEADKREAEKALSSQRQKAIAKIMPDNCAGFIIAEYHEDKSDLMSDYHGHKTTRTILLGFSKHKRMLFSEMRKAALNHPDTRHLADKVDKFEHRENYSMGAGYYLKDGHRDATGWCIRKDIYSGLLDAELCEALCATKSEQLSAANQTPVDSTLNPVGDVLRFNEAKQGIELHFGGKPEQTILDMLNSDAYSAFRYMRKKQYWYAKRSETTLQLAYDILTMLGDNDDAVTQKQLSELRDSLGVNGGIADAHPSTSTSTLSRPVFDAMHLLYGAACS